MRDLDPEQYRIHLSAHDFESAGNFILEARKFKLSDLAHEALLESAVTRYARPFSANERGNAKADARLDFDVKQVLVDSVDLDLHDRIVRIRNKMVAHAESEFFPSQSQVHGPSNRARPSYPHSRTLILLISLLLRRPARNVRGNANERR